MKSIDEREKKNNSIHSTKMIEQERDNYFCYLTFWNSRNLIQTEWNFFFFFWKIDEIYFELRCGVEVEKNIEFCLWQFFKRPIS